MTASKEAKRIIVASIQRVATETAIENAVTVFNIESDEVKGRIIGREGRNIRSFEQLTGTNLIIDDTPECVTISCFDRCAARSAASPWRTSSPTGASTQRASRRCTTRPSSW